MIEDNHTTLTRADLEREIQHLREKLELADAEREKALKIQGLEYNTFMSEFRLFKIDVVTNFATLKATALSNMRFFTVVTVLVTLAVSALSIWFRNK